MSAASIRAHPQDAAVIHPERESSHSHGLVDQSIKRSRAGLRATGIALGVLATTAAVQATIYIATDSIALLADLIHNLGDALTAVPLGAAFILRSERAERYAGLAVVLAILISAVVAGALAIERIIDPGTPEHLLALAVAGAVGFLGNEIAAQVRLRGGRKLESPALIADGYHARSDGLISLGVMLSATLVALGLRIADPVIAIIISGIILRITWQAWVTIRRRHH